MSGYGDGHCSDSYVVADSVVGDDEVGTTGGYGWVGVS